MVKLLELLLDVSKHPFTGMGKPEQLKGDLKGCWSRRINQKHRLVYQIQENIIIVLSCYGHYSDK